MSNNDENLPYSSSADRNKQPILEKLLTYLPSNPCKVLEIGSGTGQHITFFAEQFPQHNWTASDLKSNHLTLKKYIKSSGLKNIKGPEYYESGSGPLPTGTFDFYFTANTLHIMPWKAVKTLCKDLGKKLKQGDILFIYGPFNYNNEFTSPSNQEFNTWLKTQNEKSGIRNFETLKELLESYDFSLVEDHEMPANNRLLVFSKNKSGKPSRLQGKK